MKLKFSCITYVHTNQTYSATIWHCSSSGKINLLGTILTPVATKSFLALSYWIQGGQRGKGPCLVNRSKGSGENKVQ